MSETNDEVTRLQDLVKHCWVHSGYRDCGYSQMNVSMRQLYDQVIGRRKNDQDLIREALQSRIETSASANHQAELKELLSRLNT